MDYGLNTFSFNILLITFLSKGLFITFIMDYAMNPDKKNCFRYQCMKNR